MKENQRCLKLKECHHSLKAVLEKIMLIGFYIFDKSISQNFDQPKFTKMFNKIRQKFRIYVKIHIFSNFRALHAPWTPLYTVLGK